MDKFNCILMSFLLCGLAACGQKGPLYLPKPSPSPQVQQQTLATEALADRESKKK